jgi:hypothetical protein
MHHSRKISRSSMINRLSKAFSGKVVISEFTQEPIRIAAPHDESHRNYYTSGSYVVSSRSTSRFEELDDDSIYLILVALCYADVTQRLKQLWPLSLTCKRLRELCLPLMFKRVVWPNKHIKDVEKDVPPMLPKPLWPYIQYVLPALYKITIDP